MVIDAEARWIKKYLSKILCRFLTLKVLESWNYLAEYDLINEPAYLYIPTLPALYYYVRYKYIIYDNIQLFIL